MNILAIVREINSQIEEVVFAPAALIQDGLQLRLGHLVWDIPEHDLFLD